MRRDVLAATPLEQSRTRDAEHHAAALGGDGVQLDPLVLDFRASDASVDERLQILRGVAGSNASSAD